MHLVNAPYTMHPVNATSLNPPISPPPSHFLNPLRYDNVKVRNAVKSVTDKHMNAVPIHEYVPLTEVGTFRNN